MKKPFVNKLKEENQLEFGLLNKYILNIKNQDNINININISLIKEPFPILVINNAIQKDIYDKLDFEYPSLKTILEFQNNLKFNQENPIILNHTSRYSISGKTLNNNFNNNFNNNLTPLWKSFINYHNSNDKKETKDFYFKKDILDTFNKINLNENLNKNLENKNITNDNLERDFNKILNFNLDFRFNYNLPVCYNYEPKLYEIENDKIVSGWFLMRKDNDNSKGGNLEIFYETLNDNNEITKKLTKIISIPYQKNCLVLLFNQNINEKNKIKFGFSQRQLTIHTQRYLNI